MPGSFRSLLSALLLSAALARACAAQGFSIAGPDSSRLTLNGRVHALFNTTSEEDAPQAEMVLRRVRLEATMRINDLVTGRIQPEFAGSRVSLRDAYVRLTIDPAFNIWAGQAHRPFSAITQLSSNRMVPAERGLRIRGVSGAYDEYALVSELGYSERDLGVQVRGEFKDAPLGLSYAAGWFNGPARTDFPRENTGQVVARIGAAPAAKVRMNVSWSARDFAVRDSAAGDARVRRGDAWEADVELGTDAGGPHLLVEAVTGDFDPFSGARFGGAQGWLSYRTSRFSRRLSAIEPLVRVSYGDPDTGNDMADRAGPHGGTLITPGVNLWLGGLNRVAINYDIWSPREGDRAQSFKMLFQVAF
ncbi:MAG TPA: porin [Longimicrobium sp.]|jgi:hypothetical protein|uniref:porin n=1 Tax=Longimicrobium sp. TaxID=2029185 RepID=UPI002ED7BE96